MNFKETTNAGHAVIVPRLKRLGVEEIIDQHLPINAHADPPHGKPLSVLMVGGIEAVTRQSGASIRLT